MTKAVNGRQEMEDIEKALRDAEQVLIDAVLDAKPPPYSVVLPYSIGVVFHFADEVIRLRAALVNSQ